MAQSIKNLALGSRIQDSKGNKFFITNNPYKHVINSISVDNINKNKHEGRNVRDQKYLSL